MLRREFSNVVLPAVMLGCAMGACAQTEIGLLREVRVPVPARRGSFGHFPDLGMGARDHYAMRVVPDRSILIFDSDASGKWPLVRMRRWWTENPVNEVLEVPGWSRADAKYMDGIFVDVQVTPDGRYAVAFSKALWKVRSSFVLHVPSEFVERRPDTIISVIDLERWQVLNSIHTLNISGVDVRDARVVSNKWIAFDGDTGASPSDEGAYLFRDQLISIPDLKAGPRCDFRQFWHMAGAPVPESLEEFTRTLNDTACREVLSAARIPSSEALETFIRRDSGVEPRAMKLRDTSWEDDSLHHLRSEDEKLWDAERDAEQFFRHWGENPYDDLYWQNPPFESSLHLWYGLYPHGRDFYDLVRYDAAGKMQRMQTVQQLSCGDPSLGHLKSACGCRVIDVSEEQDALLAYCSQQRGDYDGMVQQQWLAVFRSDDLSGVGLIKLPKSSEGLYAIASGDGQAICGEC